MANVRRATSSELHVRLSKLSPSDRSRIIAEFESMKNMWCEEMLVKFAFWDELPHCAFAIWPKDPRSRSFAKKAVEKWEQLQPDGKKHCHRVTYRLLHPASTAAFRPLLNKLVENGTMDAALEIELQEMNMVATCEQRVEEIHARIFQLNASVGRNLDPPSTCARLRLREHLRFLSDWRCHSFLVHVWNRYLARELLDFCMDNKEFVKHAPKSDCIKAIYHCLPAQLFKNVNEDKLIHHSFKLALLPPSVNHSMPVRLFLEFCRDRLEAGTIVSFPGEVLQVERQPTNIAGNLMLVPLGDAPAGFDEKLLVQEALAVVAADVAHPSVLRMGAHLRNHRFFRVIRGNTASRFLQHNDGGHGCRVSVIELELRGRAGDEGLFPDTSDGLLNLDVLEAIRRVGTKAFFESLYLWKESQHAMINLLFPAAGVASSRMRSLSRGADATTTSLAIVSRGTTATCGWDEVVTKLLKMQDPEEREACYFDPIAGMLRSPDGSQSVEVEASTLMDLINIGVLNGGESDFGELEVKVNRQAVQWCAAAGLHHGTLDFVGHLQLDTPQKHSKLALMMYLVTQGWAPQKQGEAGDYYAIGLDKVFEVAPSRSKLYFAVLVVVDKVLGKLALDESMLPVVYHGMPESYYKLCLRMRGPADAKALLALLDKTHDVKQLPDQEFAKLLPMAERVTEVEAVAEDDGLPRNLPALLDMPKETSTAAQVDIDRVHRMAAQVLRAVPASMVDLRSTMRCADGNLRVNVHFDNFSHSSGKQRAYVACPVRSHTACFKYSIVERFESPAHVAAWLTAWARHAARQPESFTKEDHKGYEPPRTEWEALVPQMQEVVAPDAGGASSSG